MKWNVALWTAQILLALLFGYGGILKLVLPAADLAGPVAVPLLLIRFIGICETLGALGLVLPGLLHRQRGLTPLAAAGLTFIMGGATAFGFAAQVPAMVAVPLAVGALTALVCYGRLTWLVALQPGALGLGLPEARRATLAR